MALKLQNPPPVMYFLQQATPQVPHLTLITDPEPALPSLQEASLVPTPTSNAFTSPLSHTCYDVPSTS